MSDQDGYLTAAEALERWAVADLDRRHEDIGLGAEWLASERRAELVAIAASHVAPETAARRTERHLGAMHSPSGTTGRENGEQGDDK